jgi:ribose/xylose/arabinose/galactoside ABC-type transport system permease subunit
MIGSRVAGSPGQDRVRLRDILTSPVFSIGLVLAAVVVVGLVVVGPRFLSTSNLTIIGSNVGVILLIGAFSGFALLAGVVDLSIGSAVGLGAAVFGSLLFVGWDPALAALATLPVGLIIGAINATAIVRFGGNAIAVTLGTLTAFRGVTLVLVEIGGGRSIPAFNLDLFKLANTSVGGLPALFLVALVVTGIAAVVVSRTRVGRRIKAVGGDDRAAARAGISVVKIRTGVLLLSAVGAVIGGIILVTMTGQAAGQTGFGLEFQVYAALMIGGYSILRGGIGNPIGGALGILAIAALSNMLNLTAISPWFTDIFVGVLLLGAVYLDRLRGGDAFE